MNVRPPYSKKTQTSPFLFYTARRHGAMSKAEVAAHSHSLSELSRLCAAWGVVLREHRRLYGGYSGSNYLVVGTDGSRA
eukprot:scaffold194829_cov14-Tisochrysis_lutea.AAC.1